MSHDELLPVAAVVTELKITRATFYRWRSLGKGPKTFKLPNGKIRVRRSELNRFLASCEK